MNEGNAHEQQRRPEGNYGDHHDHNKNMKGSTQRDMYAAPVPGRQCDRCVRTARTHTLIGTRRSYQEDTEVCEVVAQADGFVGGGFGGVFFAAFFAPISSSI